MSKIKNLNGYYIGRKISNWHSFLDLISILAIWLGVLAAISIIIFIATLSFWI